MDYPLWIPIVLIVFGLYNIIGLFVNSKLQQGGQIMGCLFRLMIVSIILGRMYT